MGDPFETNFTKTQAANENLAESSRDVYSAIASLQRELQQGHPSLPSDLDEAAEEYANKHLFKWPNQVSAGKEGFIAGAQWQKKQMMKDAIVLDDFCIDDFSCGYYNLCVEQGLTSEDKVKIIIVKEDKG